LAPAWLARKVAPLAADLADGAAHGAVLDQHIEARGRQHLLAGGLAVRAQVDAGRMDGAVAEVDDDAGACALLRSLRLHGAACRRSDQPQRGQEQCARPQPARSAPAQIVRQQAEEVHGG
jgi:hypothetical protein